MAEYRRTVTASRLFKGAPPSNGAPRSSIYSSTVEDDDPEEDCRKGAIPNKPSDSFQKSLRASGPSLLLRVPFSRALALCASRFQRRSRFRETGTADPDGVAGTREKRKSDAKAKMRLPYSARVIASAPLRRRWLIPNRGEELSKSSTWMARSRLRSAQSGMNRNQVFRCQRSTSSSVKDAPR